MKQVLLAFLLLILVVVFGFVTTGLTVNNKAFNLSVASTKKTNLLLGSEKNLSLLSYGIKWTPDGHISYITFPDGKRKFFISGNQKTYTIEVPAPLSLQDALAKNPLIKENFGPDKNVSYRNFYAAITSVIQTEPKNPYHLMAFTQNEEQTLKPDGSNDYAHFTSSIGLLESYDGGNTWKDFGPIIKGDDYLAPGTKITGAGEPSAITKDGYIYVYFTDWSARGIHPDQIYLARSKIFPDGGLGKFEFYKSNGFSDGEQNLQPVIKLSENINDKYISLPSISYNKYLNQYLAIYETNTGFYQAVSLDGINFTNEKLIFNFPQPQSERKTGDIWYSYPTLLSDGSEKNDGVSKNNGNFYFATGVWPNTAHQLSVKPFEFR